MENKNISQIVQERIKEEGIKPISRKVFSIKRVAFWVIVFSSLLVGAFTFSLALSSLLNNDWDLYNKFGLNFVFKTLPYFWLLSLALFTILGEYYYRKTLLGHRRGIFVILGIYVVFTSVFGLTFYLVGVSNFTEKYLEEGPTVYRNILLNRHEVWSHPDDGLLSGKITRIAPDVLEIIDPNGFVWIVDTSSAVTRGKTEIEIGERIKIIGDKTDNNSFDADELRPWIGMNLLMR